MHTTPSRRALPPRSARAGSLFLLFAAAGLASCVTTVSGPTRRGIPLVPTSSSSTGTNAAAPGDTPVAMPTGPVAQPATESSTRAARTTVAIMEIGLVPSDGQVLPLVSPDGRFVAAEFGTPPGWNLLLGAGPQRPSLGTQLAAFSIEESAIVRSERARQPTALKPIAWSAPLPAGLVLGRSCDTSGFLVEAPQSSGERWIGKVDWVSGTLRWLVRDQFVNSGAALGPAGELAYSRRAVGEDRRTMVVRQSAGDDRPETAAILDDPGVSFSFPGFSAEPGMVFTFASTGSALELQAYRLPTIGQSTQLMFLGGRQLLNRPDEAAAYQACNTVAIPAVAVATSQESAGFAFFHPGQGRMCVFDPRAGSIRSLEQRSISAIAIEPAEPNGGRAFMVTTEKALKYSEFADRSASGLPGVDEHTSDGVKLVAGALLPRQTTNTQWPFVLVGPGSRSDEGAYRIFKMRLGATN